MNASRLSATAARRAFWLVNAAMAYTLLAPTPSTAVVIPNPGPVPQATFQLYTIPGAFERTSMKRGTFFFCTSLETQKVAHIRVDLRDALGKSRNIGANNGAADIAPGQTVTIATHDSPAFAEDVILSLSPSAADADGSARIVSNTTKVMCSAILVQDQLGVEVATGANGPPPAAMHTLRIIKAGFQTGD